MGGNSDLWELIEEVTTELSPLARQKGLDLTSHQQTTVTEIVGDPLQLRRVISNLLSNSLFLYLHIF